MGGSPETEQLQASATATCIVGKVCKLDKPDFRLLFLQGTARE